MLNKVGMAALVLWAALPAAGFQATERWDRDNGKPAPRLTAAAWCGSPVSLDAVKGNTVVLGFWNADIPC